MSGFIGVAGYTKTFDRLDIELLKNNPQRYYTVIIQLVIEEAKRGYYYERINKATKKGTSIRFKVIQTEEQANYFKTVIQKMVNDVNDKYNSDLVLEFN